MTIPYTNSLGRGWAIKGPVTRFRVWGSERVYDLTASDRWVLGSGPDCSLRLDDPSGHVSHHHAVASRSDEIWTVHDVGSTNGLRLNGEERRSFQLAPCDEIKLGDVTLLAESPSSIVLHDLLRQCLGWAASRIIDVDRALLDIREMAHLRAALILRGTNSLIKVAQRLHRTILGDQPFVMLGPNDHGLRELDRAKNGTLCVNAGGLPPDFRLVVANIRTLDMRVRLLICAETSRATTGIAAMISRIVMISIPSLAERPGNEIERLVEAYAAEVTAEIGVPRPGLWAGDPELISASGVASFDEMEHVARRLVTLRNYGVVHGADRLNITHGALSRWAKRYGLPT